MERPGGKVYFVPAVLTGVMKWDGEKKETFEADYCGTDQRPVLTNRVLSYLKHDMVTIFNRSIVH